MTEKYKIYIPEGMKNRLMNDADLFEFYKKDGSINLNSFLKELLVNYFDEYREKKEHLLNDIANDLNKHLSLSPSEAELLADKVINTYMKSDIYKNERSTTVTLTVSGRSLDVCRSIENNLLLEKSMSQYINDMFASYLSIARNNREKIIFKETYEDLVTAIRQKNVITFSSSSAPKLVFSIKPYILAASKEEQCNYLLCTDTSRGLLRTFRISRITSLFITSKRFDEDEDVKTKLQEIALRSPQSASQVIDAEVFLTDRGIDKFRVIVKNRPDVLKKEGNIYYFKWPRMQLEEYFARFGHDAIILKPKECRNSMKNFYRKALEAYTNYKTT
ncbi:MAG: WYL domain-containing protein [Lachnospiraceae bacterium]|nr:WYL domain-containing protein [Lachnospiraceae bacterium]